MDYKDGKIDLHIHSNASDGSLAPKQILQLAISAGLSAIAITDHDTVSGTLSLLHHGIPETIEFVSGVEISTAFPPSFCQSGSMHLLGYGFNAKDPELTDIFIQQQSARTARNPMIVEKLNHLGIDISLEDIIDTFGKEAIGRPHIADYMVRKGFAHSIDDAFDRFLGKGMPAYVDKFRIPAADAIKRIHAAGGIPVLAHPVVIQSQLSTPIEALVPALKEMGLQGIEAYYPGQTDEQTRDFLRIADQFDLLVTGGSDFHGAINPDVRIGSGRGDLHVPYSVFARLKNAIQSSKDTAIHE